MGINGLLKLVDPIADRCHVSRFKGQTVGVDASCWLYRAAYTCALELGRGQQSYKYLNFLRKLLHSLKQHDVKPYVVFDGCELPAKAGTNKSRSAERQSARMKAEEAYAAGDRQTALDWYQRSIQITPTMARNFMELCKLEKIPFTVAMYEADAQLAYLYRTQQINAVLTEDSDLLVFGVEQLITKYELEGYCKVIAMDNVRAYTGSDENLLRLKRLLHDQSNNTQTFSNLLIQTAVLSGCDYLPNLPGIAMMKSLKLFSDYGQLMVVLNKIKQNKQAAKAMTKEYETQYDNAVQTFLHQYVYCTKRQQCMHLSDATLTGQLTVDTSVKCSSPVTRSLSSPAKLSTIKILNADKENCSGLSNDDSIVVDDDHDEISSFCSVESIDIATNNVERSASAIEQTDCRATLACIGVKHPDDIATAIATGRINARSLAPWQDDASYVTQHMIQHINSAGDLVLPANFNNTLLAFAAKSTTKIVSSDAAPVAPFEASTKKRTHATIKLAERAPQQPIKKLARSVANTVTVAPAASRGLDVPDLLDELFDLTEDTPSKTAVVAQTAPLINALTQNPFVKASQVGSVTTTTTTLFSASTTTQSADSGLQTLCVSSRTRRQSVAMEEVQTVNFATTSKYHYHWTVHDNTLHIMQPCKSFMDATPIACASKKLAAFDMDGTLIKTKSGRVFPTGRDDWVWWHKTAVQEKLHALHHDGYRIVLFSNQAGMANKSTGKIKQAEIHAKLIAIAGQLHPIPVTALCAGSDDQYRKPNTQMWKHLLLHLNNNQTVDLQQCMFVGDAAGRRAGHDGNPSTKVDFSCSDRKFAHNISIRFHTPEEYFLAAPAAPFDWGESGSVISKLDAQVIAANAAALEQQQSDQPVAAVTTVQSAAVPVGADYSHLVESGQQQLFICVGWPASGKSTFVRKWLTAHGVEWVNQDTLKTKEKCLKHAKEHLAAGKSCVIDNTNAGTDIRKQYITIAKQHKVPVTCLHFLTDVATAKHLNVVREKVYNIPHVSRIAYNVFNKNFVQPAAKEGFAEMVEIPFVAEFTDEVHRKAFNEMT